MRDASTDAAPVDAASDAARFDGSLDARVPDAEVTDPDCITTPDAITVALYTFDSDPPTSVRNDGPGGGSGSIIGTIPHVAGRCGQAIHFGTTDPTPFVGIPDSPSWDLPVGSLDFWVRVPAALGAVGILSRDALGNVESGHLTVYLGETGHLVVRMQSDTDDNAVFRCSDAPVPVDTWVRVGINFGAPGVELWVDGALSSRVADVPLDSSRGISVAFCANNAPIGIDGNGEPWLLGGSADTSPVGATSPVLPFADGEIDQLRISSGRRDYSAP